MRLLSEADVERLIDPTLAIQCAEDAYVQQALGETLEPGRLDLRRSTPKAGVLVVAGFGHDSDTFVAKTNAHAWPVAGGPRVNRSLLVLWDMAQARALALMAATNFNDHRTAAGFAAAAKVLAAPNASVLAIFGAGKLALPSLTYVAAVRPIRRVLIVGRDPARARALAVQARRCEALASIEIDAIEDPAFAAAQADVIVTVTTSDTPVFPGQVVREGTLVVLGGANRPSAREVDDALIRRAQIFTDHLQGALGKGGDLKIPIEQGVISRDAFAGDIGAFIRGPQTIPFHAGVRAFKSIGIALQDLVLARALLARAEEQGQGTWFDANGASDSGSLA